VPESLKEVFARGYRARAENDLAEARAAFLEAVRRASLETDRPALAEALCGLAQAERGIGNPGAAIHQYANAALLYRELGSRERFAYAIRHEADILRETGKTTEAKPRYLEAEEIYRQLGDRATLDLANTLRGLALASKGIDASKPSGRRHVSFTKNAKSRLA
jgi:tetratricopeptide (TPR) repeat protein